MKRTGFLLCLLCLAQIIFAQQRVLNGRVLDLYLTQPIPGARVQAGDRVSLTDSAGNFSILVGDPTLVSVSATAYNTRFYTIYAASSLTVFLNPVNYGTNYLQVRGLNNGADLFHTPGSIASLGPRDFLRNNQVDLPQTFNLQPGVRMEFRSINTGARILIRGYGNQNNFNGIGYKAYYDDIPLTDADGTTLLDDIDFASLGRVEVFRGPVSSEYGTGIGGAVQFYSEKAPPGITLKQDILVGAEALFRNTSTVSVGNETTNLSLHFGHQQTDGYRMNNASNKDFWSLNATFYSSPKRTISCLVYYSKSADQLPGQLDSSGLINYPDSADLSYLNNHSHSNLESVRMGITQEYRFNTLLSNRTSLFIGSQEQEQGVATVLTRTQKSDFGFRTSFLYTPRL
ncbi:MAG TPA: TonB-dependent receptor, partial [Sediminibacterium sp.]|nr:TonB-dependent receptor [Sediminibacterium sp.]